MKKIIVCITVLGAFVLSGFTIAGENSQKRIQTELLSLYDSATQTLTIPKLGVPSADAGYAYNLQMKLFSNAPIGFMVSNITLSGNITPEEEISALYSPSTHSIYFPTVVIVAEDGSQTTIDAVNLQLSGDPFVWFYLPDSVSSTGTDGTANTTDTTTTTAP